MQKVAAYFLERRARFENSASLMAEYETCSNVVRQWLTSKDAGAATVQAGSYRAEDGSEGKFQWESAKHGERAWQLLRLDETAVNGTRHIASVSVTNTGTGIAVYVTIEVGLSFSTIKPIHTDPRCPRVVRSLLDLPGNWCHGHSQLSKLQRVVGLDNGKKLVAQITDQKRTVPILVISEDEGFLALPGLDNKAAYDLAGLANTYLLDREASWGLTGLLGKSYSCFSGAVRVYWPRFSLQDDPFSHPLWTGSRLASYSDSFATTEELFRRQLRQMLMQASALSVLRPREIDEILNAEKTSHLAGLMERAKSGADFEQLALAFAKDNDDLRVKVENLTKTTHALSEELEDTRIRLTNAELISRYQSQPEPQIAPLGPDDPEADKGPQPGEVRYYKKTHSTDKYDVMTLVGDCGCNRWQSAKKADKAKKGVERYEGRKDWKSIQHCASCTGGGMWKVKW